MDIQAKNAALRERIRAKREAAEEQSGLTKKAGIVLGLLALGLVIGLLIRPSSPPAPAERYSPEQQAAIAKANQRVAEARAKQDELFAQQRAQQSQRAQSRTMYHGRDLKGYSVDKVQAVLGKGQFMSQTTTDLCSKGTMAVWWFNTFDSSAGRMRLVKVGFCHDDDATPNAIVVF